MVIGTTRRLIGTAAVIALAGLGLTALASPASAATVTSIQLSPVNYDTDSGTCVFYAVTELAANGSPATTGTFEPTTSVTDSATTNSTTYSTADCTTPGNGATQDPDPDLGGATYDFAVNSTTTSRGTVNVTASDPADPSITATTSLAVSSVKVTLNAGGNPNSCPTNAASTTKDVGTATAVCSLVTEDGGTQPVANAAVSFTVTSGAVADTASDAMASGAATTYVATTDSRGIAIAYVYSRSIGRQTTTAGALARSSTDLVTTYQQVAGTHAANLTLTPSQVQVPAGSQQLYTASVTDVDGNAFAGVTVTFNETGSGAISSNNSTTTPIRLTTNNDGLASVYLTVPTDAAAGQGTVTASAPTPDSATSQTSNDTSTYTVTTTGNVSAYAAKGAKVGRTTFASSLALNASGAPIVGETLHFTIMGSTNLHATAVTDANGRAKLTYISSHAGSFTVQVNDESSPKHTAFTSSSAVRAYYSTTLAQISPRRYRIRDTATIGIQKAGVRVDFYQHRANGKNVLVGSVNTNADGVAVYVHYNIKSGYRYTGIAKISGANRDYNGPNSASVTTTVK